jgi:hypothetical protein
MFVDGVVEDLGNAVVEGSFIGPADIHARLFTDGFEAFEFAEFGGVVVAFDGGIFERLGRIRCVGHANGKSKRV